jgi:hypothetical protein
LPRFDPRHPDTIRYLDGTEEQVDGGDPMNYVQIFTTGPGQIVTEIPECRRSRSSATLRPYEAK